MTFVVAGPALILGHVNAFGPGADHPKRPEFTKYEYLRVRSKVSIKQNYIATIVH